MAAMHQHDPRHRTCDPPSLKTRMKKFPDIVLIGAGNVATRLGLALINSGCRVIQVYSRSERSAKALAKKFSCSYTSACDLISKKAGLYIIAVNDDTIKKIAGKIKVGTRIVVHTSGSV